MLANFRDISIILLALESIVIGVILLLLLWQVRLLVLLLRDEIRPILKDTQETTKTVQSTTKFVGKRITKPVVKTLSIMAGIKGAVRAMKEEVAPTRPSSGASDNARTVPFAESQPTTPPSAPTSPDYE